MSLVYSVYSIASPRKEFTSNLFQTRVTASSEDQCPRPAAATRSSEGCWGIGSKGEEVWRAAVRAVVGSVLPVEPVCKLIITYLTSGQSNHHHPLLLVIL